MKPSDTGGGKTVGIQDIASVLEFYRALGIERMAAEIPGPACRDEKAAAVYSSAPEAKDRETNALLLRGLREELGDCRRCKLYSQRKNIVFGDGNPAARLMFIGEGPGRDEDLQGLPFVGEAGQVLTNLIKKMGFTREEVYIANIVKCRPPMNRDPEEDEIAVCRDFIEKQIEIIRPEVIMTLGRISLQTLMNDSKLRITAARGKFLDYMGIPVMPTFHPAYLLRSPADKWKTWSDAQKVLEKLNR